ncbi:hypothetical protein C8R44DRAFT_735803 [Mycena epipterygia]|nr:hypothetical protein C8R44DRAFT_735803 [Mycena epipterygia]
MISPPATSAGTRTTTGRWAYVAARGCRWWKRREAAAVVTADCRGRDTVLGHGGTADTTREAGHCAMTVLDSTARRRRLMSRRERRHDRLPPLRSVFVLGSQDTQAAARGCTGSSCATIPVERYATAAIEGGKLALESELDGSPLRNTAGRVVAPSEAENSLKSPVRSDADTHIEIVEQGVGRGGASACEYGRGGETKAPAEGRGGSTGVRDSARAARGPQRGRWLIAKPGGHGWRRGGCDYSTQLPATPRTMTRAAEISSACPDPPRSPRRPNVRKSADGTRVSVSTGEPKDMEYLATAEIPAAPETGDLDSLSVVWVRMRRQGELGRPTLNHRIRWGHCDKTRLDRTMLSPAFTIA